MKGKTLLACCLLIASAFAYAGNGNNSSQNEAPKSSRFLSISLSALTGIDDGANILNSGITLVSGIRFASGIRLGLGSGIEKFDESVIPFFCYFSLPFGKSPSFPFVYLKGGYGVAFLSSSTQTQWDDRGSYGGLMLGSGVSLTVFSWQGAVLSAGIGYRFQKLIGKEQGPWHTRKIVDVNRIDLQLAINF